MNQRQAASLITYAEKILLANIQGQGIKPMHIQEQVQNSFDMAATFADAAQSLWNVAEAEKQDLEPSSSSDETGAEGYSETSEVDSDVAE